MGNPFAVTPMIRAAGNTAASNNAISGLPFSGAVSGGVSTTRTATTDVMSGRITLAVMEVLIVSMIAFYIWTHGIQGGG